jgi:hypothetical protein
MSGLKNEQNTKQGTPLENDMAFCCYCGKPLTEASYEIEDDE